MVRFASFFLCLSLAPAGALAQSGVALTSCDIGKWVMVPGYPDPGTIQAERDGTCIIAMQNGETEEQPFAALTSVASPDAPAPSAPPAPGSLAAPKPGAWACTVASAPDTVLSISFSAPDGYTAADGQSGVWATIDGASIEFQTGPYAGQAATLVKDMMSFTPPGATEALACAFAG